MPTLQPLDCQIITRHPHLIDTLPLWFHNPKLLLFGDLHESLQRRWLQAGGSLEWITQKQINFPKELPESQAARYRIHVVDPDAFSPNETYEIFYFKNNQPLESNISIWYNCRDHLAKNGLVIIETPKSDSQHHTKIGRTYLNDLWHDCTNSLFHTFQPAFADWLRHREGLQSIEIPQKDAANNYIILQKGERHLGGAEARLCVATFGEDITWLKNLHLDACVYDATGSRHGLIPAPNIAREASQYLRHIITHYGQFASHEIFIQGKPIDHSPNIISDINRGIYRERSVRALGPLTGFDYSTPHQHDKWAQQMAHDLFDGLPHGLQWTPGAQFSVSRKALESRSLEFWRMLLSKVEAEATTSPWAIERLWLTLC